MRRNCVAMRQRRHPVIALAVIVATGWFHASQADPTVPPPYFSVELRVADTGGKTATVAEPGDVVNIDVYLHLLGQNNKQEDDLFTDLLAGFQSSTGGILGDLLDLRPAPSPGETIAPRFFTGTKSDYDLDGDLDIRSASPSQDSGSVGFFSAFPDIYIPFPSTGRILLGRLRFTAVTLSNTPTAVTVAVTEHTPRALGKVDGQNVSSTTNQVDLGWMLIGEPVLISAAAPVPAPGPKTYLAGAIGAHLSLADTYLPAADATFTLSMGFDVVPGGLLTAVNDAATVTASHVYINDASSGNFGGTISLPIATIGQPFAGTFTQSAGLSSIDQLMIGTSDSAPGTLVVSGGMLKSQSADAGHGGPATIIISGGTATFTKLDLGETAPASLSLSGDGMLNGRLAVGVGASGILRQTGGSLVSDRVDVGTSSGIPGEFYLERGSLQADGLAVNASGTQAGVPSLFAQSGGLAQLAGLTASGQSAQVQLTGGICTVDGTIGVLQGATFEQAGAVVSCSALSAISNGIVRITGGATSITNAIYIGTPPRPLTVMPALLTPGAYFQTGGELDVTDMVVGLNGVVTLSGGSLRIGHGAAVAGIVDFADSDMTLTIGDNVIANFSWGSIVNARNATIVAGTGTLLEFPPSFDRQVDLGNTQTQGIVHRAGQPLLMPPGMTIGGTGLIIGDTTNQGTLSPGQSPGLIAIEGSYTQDAAARLLIELTDIGSSQYDQVQVSGIATLGGLLEVRLLDDFVPSPDVKFTFFTSGTAITGTFTNAAETIETDRGIFDVTYSAKSVTLSGFRSVPEPTSLLGLTAAGMLGRRRRRW